MATVAGSKVWDRVLVALTATIVRGQFVVPSTGAVAGAGAFGLPAMENGVSGQNIGLASFGSAFEAVAGAVGVNAGDKVQIDASGYGETYSSGVCVGRAITAATNGQSFQYIPYAQ